MTDFGNESNKKKRLLLALLSSSSIQQAAVKAGVSLSTAFRWRRQPRFQAKLNQLRKQHFDDGWQAMQALSQQAVQALERNLSCGRPAVEVAAATKVLELGIKFSEVVDLSQRLDAIEAIQKKVEQEA